MAEAGTANGVGRLAEIRRVLGRQEDPYAGADHGNACRLFGILSLLSTILIVLYLPFDPPIDAIGYLGWPAAALLVGFGLAIPRALLRTTLQPSFNSLLVLSYLGLAGVALLEWLAGGAESAYQNLFLLWALVGAGIHPPRRALPLLAAAALVAALPLLYDGWSSDLAWHIAAPALMWWAFGFVLMALMTYVRGQRVRFTEQQQQADELARVDELTGLKNRRAFQEELEAEIARTRRAGASLSVAVLDIDDFKQVNDDHGHLEGDGCLQSVAAALSGSMRSSDGCYRWGGDEFAVVLPGTDETEAAEILARIVSAVSASCTRPDGSQLIVSHGLAELEEEHSADELIGLADLALMATKRTRGVQRA